MHSTVLRLITNLKSRWTDSTQLERGEAVDGLVKRGISRRALAREVGRTEALLRYLQRAAHLPSRTRCSGYVWLTSGQSIPALLLAFSRQSGVPVMCQSNRF